MTVFECVWCGKKVESSTELMPDDWRSLVVNVNRENAFVRSGPEGYSCSHRCSIWAKALRDNAEKAYINYWITRCPRDKEEEIQ